MEGVPPQELYAEFVVDQYGVESSCVALREARVEGLERRTLISPFPNVNKEPEQVAERLRAMT